MFAKSEGSTAGKAVPRRCSWVRPSRSPAQRGGPASGRRRWRLGGSSGDRGTILESLEEASTDAGVPSRNSLSSLTLARPHAASASRTLSMVAVRREPLPRREPRMGCLLVAITSTLRRCARQTGGTYPRSRCCAVPSSRFSMPHNRGEAGGAFSSRSCRRGQASSWCGRPTSRRRPCEQLARHLSASTWRSGETSTCSTLAIDNLNLRPPGLQPHQSRLIRSVSA
jgi:hypothetical protein